MERNAPGLKPACFLRLFAGLKPGAFTVFLLRRTLCARVAYRWKTSLAAEAGVIQPLLRHD
jgi:hypothetical protein